MDLQLTEPIRHWLESDDISSQHIIEGATLLLRVNKNRIFYDNVCRSPEKFLPRLRYELQKVLDIRDLAEKDKADRIMMRQIAHEAENVIKEKDSKQFQRGKRADHDSLPADIRQLYVENDAIRARMRRCHEMLKSITPQNSSCPDSDRYPWAKELLSLNKQYKNNWKVYDSYEETGKDSRHNTSVGQDSVPAVHV